jgi:hypothetical protein
MRAVFLILALAGLQPAAGERFSFRTNEFRLEGDARAAAAAFVERAFPPGLPMTEARARAQAAEMTCRPAKADAGLACVYSVPVHAPGGVIGENTWTLRLTPDGSGRLAAADLVYDRGGFDTP